VKDEKEPNRKRPYEKPVLRVIPLVAEEVLGTKCKAGVGSHGPGFGCGNINCMSTGGS
jgi:hypothetical protein